MGVRATTAPWVRQWAYQAGGVTLTVSTHRHGSVHLVRRGDGPPTLHRADGPGVADLAAWAVLHDDPTYLIDHLAEEYGGVWGEAALAIAASRGG